MKLSHQIVVATLLFFGYFVNVAGSEISKNFNGVAFEKDLSGILSAQELNGITWHMIAKETSHSGGSGLANIADNRSMTDTTPVHIGSVAKTILAIGVMRLIEQSDLSLDSAVAPLLSTQIFDNPWHNSSPISVRHLLEHTAGLNNLKMWQFLNSKPTKNTPLIKALVPSDGSLLKIHSEPGTQYSYSNIGYTLLAMVIEKVSGERYEDYLDREILMTFGMKQSTFHFTHQEQSEKGAKLAMGYFEDNREIQALPMYLRPAGQFTTTAKDMILFSKFMLGDGNLNSEQFIQADMMTHLAEPSTTDAAVAGLRIGHGLALALRDRHDVLGQCHPGTTFGFRANFCLFPDQGKAFFYSVNTDSETADYGQFDIAFIDALNLNRTPAVESTSDSDTSEKTDIEGFYLFSPNNMEEFAWLDTVFGVQYLSWRDSHLIVQSLQNEEKVLSPINRSLFRSLDRNLSSHVVYDKSNNRFLSDGLNTYKKTSAFVVVCYWASLILGLLGLVYIFIVACYRFLRRTTNTNKYLQWPWYSMLLFTLPIAAFSQQNFMQFGELTLAGGSLTIVSSLLPALLVASIIQMTRHSDRRRVFYQDLTALVMASQLMAVLIYWQVLPIKFWVVD